MSSAQMLLSIVPINGTLCGGRQTNNTIIYSELTMFQQHSLYFYEDGQN